MMYRLIIYLIKLKMFIINNFQLTYVLLQKKKTGTGFRKSPPGMATKGTGGAILFRIPVISCPFTGQMNVLFLLNKCILLSNFSVLTGRKIRIVFYFLISTYQ